MASIFWLQLRALIWKNWLVIAKHPWVSILRAFILPVAYGIFLATAQVFLVRLNNYGIGDPVPIKTLAEQYDGKTAFVWTDATDPSSSLTGQAIIDRITTDFNPLQRAAIKKLDLESQIPAECPQNFNLYSHCFAAIAFSDIPGNGSLARPINYTIYADGGLAYINVEKHTSDFEKRILPIQWAIDKAIIELQTGVEQRTPMEWPFSQITNKEQLTRLRQSYNRGIRELIGLAFFINFVGIAYQLPGSFSGERALLITEHMKAMGVLDSARILSWHIGISSTYLPAWIIVSLVWKFQVFAETNAGLIIILHILLGMVLASWSFFVAAPFGKSPQLAAVVTTFLAIIFAVLGLVINPRGATAFIFSIVIPPSFYIFALKAITGYENHGLATNALKGDPDRNIRLLPILLAAVIDLFLWPYLAVVWEWHIYTAPVPGKRSWAFWRKNKGYEHPPVPENTAISIRNLTKVYKTSWFGSKGDVTAVSGLSLDIPKTGIFVLLGSNGAGKSTTLSVIAGLSSITDGTVTYEGGYPRPQRGTLGIVPQKNVLFPDLTCLQTLRVWRAVKWSSNSEADEDLVQLLKDCDLEKKIHANADTLSGGQKRKLQLAIGLLGGSKIVLVDECTSGVDPLSRRAVWRTLTSFREDRCIVFTTHFLDEADLLADHIAILAAPGKVVASGPPVTLKRDLGEGYSIQVTFSTPVDPEKVDESPNRAEPFEKIKNIVPLVYVTTSSPITSCFHLKTRETGVVRQVLEVIDAEVPTGRVASYDILGTTIEDIFLDLMSKHNVDSDDEKVSEEISTPVPVSKTHLADLPVGRKVSPFKQAFTILFKRLLIARRSWLTPLLTILVAVCGACIPLIFLEGRRPSCVRRFRNTTSIAVYYPNSTIMNPPVPFGLIPPPSRPVLTFPDVRSMLSIPSNAIRVMNLPDNATFVNTINANYSDTPVGGVSVDLDSGESLFAWEATPPGLTALSMLNLVSNVLYHRAMNETGSPTSTLIRSYYAPFPPVFLGILGTLRWVFFFGAVMAVYPAFFALYVSRERRSSVQAMQLSNGLTDPIGLWLGHLMFDLITILILSTIIVAIFAAVAEQLYGLGFLWFIMVLYGITGALFSYCIALVVSSPLAAFAAAAGYQFVVFILYLSAYLLILTYGPITESSRLINIAHFSTSIAAPVASVARAALVSLNLFSLLCEGTDVVTSSSLRELKRFGGPILYLFVYMLVLLGILVWADSGSRVKRRFKRQKVGPSPTGTAASSKEDVAAVAKHVEDSDDLLRVVNISKTYSGNKVVDDVSLGVPKDTLFALLGPNGAGKTTTFNIIRGDVVPNSGDVFIGGTSVISHPRTARSLLGVCPQFTAIDPQLTTREHLNIYARLKGLQVGPELDRSVNSVLEDTSLMMYADRLASQLSGGNQRKLSLAIALIGNPPVILIDEFSTGVDPKMKRDMWQTLRRVAVGKAVIITTHSMEEASALANGVGILAKRMLAVGTTESLSARYATYEVHFTCRNREEVTRARTLMSLIPGSRMADDVATRFEVPLAEGDNNSLSKLFNTLSQHGDFTEYTVERASLESVFLKVIRQNDVKEEDSSDRRSRWMRFLW